MAKYLGAILIGAAIVFSVENRSSTTKEQPTFVIQSHLSYDAVEPIVYVALNNCEVPVISENPLLLLSAEENPVAGTVPTVLATSNSPPVFVS